MLMRFALEDYVAYSTMEKMMLKQSLKIFHSAGALRVVVAPNRDEVPRVIVGYSAIDDEGQFSSCSDMVIEGVRGEELEVASFSDGMNLLSLSVRPVPMTFQEWIAELGDDVFAGSDPEYAARKAWDAALARGR